ncbi:MAG TPA: carboxypeptidase-like regulatory domain-containing protein [Bryobacteraceae bacterium]|nr:carboxypeptidase-like regulatory domain-containing protein [Bryobacteraceae bacterium]
MRNHFFAIWALLLCLSLPVLGQTFGEISGEIRDSSGATIPDANVTLTNVDTNATRQAVSNNAGIYSFPSIPPGSYQLRVEKEGFKTTTRTEILVQVQQTVRLDVEMALGTVAETVEVSAAAAMLTTENATVGTVIENKRIVELPLNGRNYLQLVSLSPNVSYGFSNAGQAGSRQGGDRASQNIAVAGQRSYFNQFTLDGVNNTDPNFNTYVIQPSIDALQEFKVQTGIYPAEFGRQATQINVSTKPGTNDYHGTLYEFLRNDKLDAKNYAFTTARPPKDPFKWNQFGFTLGGPVVIPKLFNGRNRLFFMTNYEWFRQRRQVQALYDLPSAAMRTGDFSELLSRGTVIYDPATRVVNADGTVTAQAFAGNIIPANRINAISRRLLEFYPTPNNPNALLRQNHQIAQGRPINKDQFTGRGDFVESSSSQWFGRYSYGDENLKNEALFLNGSAVVTNTKQYMLSNVRVLGPTKVNEFRFGFTQFDNAAQRELANVRDVVTELNIPGLRGGDPATWGIPSVSITNYSGFGDDSESPYVNNNKSMQFIDNFSSIRGKHSLRFGGEVRRDEYNQVGNQFPRGSFLFDVDATRTVVRNSSGSLVGSGGDAFADFLLGNTKRAEASVAIAQAEFRNWSYAAYFDDVWKLTSKLTLNLGLRYELTPPWEDQTGRLFTVAIPSNIQSGPVSDLSLHPYFLRQGSAGGDPLRGVNLAWPGIRVEQNGTLGNRLVKTDYNDIAPRIGLTWSATSKLVIRAGFGMFYSQDTGNPRFDMARNLAGRTRFESLGTTLYTVDNAFIGLANPPFQVPTPYSFANEYNRRTPRTHMYLFNIQYELPGANLLEIGYVGSQIRHSEQLIAVNEAIPGPTGSIAQRSPFPEFGRIQLVDNGGTGNYNGFSLKLTKRYSNGLTYLVGYTWSKALDTGSAIRTHDGDTLFPQNSYCRDCEYGLSSFHTAHRLVSSVLYDMPFGRGRQFNIQNPILNAVAGGWQISNILSLQTGFPITVTIGGLDQSRTGGGFDRPNATGQDPYAVPGGQRPTRWYNLDAFAVQPSGTFGNVGRNTVIGPGIFQFDASLLKNFNITEDRYLQFRFEAFNALNHPNWGNPNTNVNNRNTFGTISGTRNNMRQLQLALKFVF